MGANGMLESLCALYRGKCFLLFVICLYVSLIYYKGSFPYKPTNEFTDVYNNIIMFLLDPKQCFEHVSLGSTPNKICSVATFHTKYFLKNVVSM